MSGSVVVVGSFNLDHVWSTSRFPVPGETRLGSFTCGPGGKGFNQAIASVRQGAPTHFIAAIGSDAIGDGAAALATTEGLQAHWQRCPTQATGTAAIVLDGQGQNLIVVGPGANAALSVEHVQAQAAVLRGARVLLTQHEVDPLATRCAHALARAAGVLVIHNPAPPVDATAQPALDGIDLITPNETEFAQLLRDHAGHDIAAAYLVQQEEPILHRLCRDLGVPTVIVTLGADGVFVSQANGYTRIAAEAVNVRDTTGAGDAFNGALAAALAGGQPLLDAVAQANRVAGLKVERHGAALAMPTRAEVRERFATA
ncbi:ribokinase [Arenimonas oryziterrae]|uniref:ribokinase n=1 Tax=Arenimonas oryziterrae TaxID=498055 RepID=UPI0003B539C3|nr:ribokinase [Arenimonas oryziterrae]